MIEEKLISGKCYKLLNKFTDKGHWNAASFEYVKGKRHSQLIRCYYGDPILFLEKVIITDCTYANEFLKCLIDGKIGYIDHWHQQLIFEQIK